MPIPWGVIVALGVVAFAYFIKHFLDEILEDDKEFWIVIFVFLAVYVGAAFAVGSLNPKTIYDRTFSIASNDYSVGP